MKGNLLENETEPKVGMAVWIKLTEGWVHGRVTAVYNIDDRGLANTYCDVSFALDIWHQPINCLFDHKPQLVEVTDEWGKCHVWQ